MNRIDRERYVSAEFARLEWERVFARVWLLAARSSDLPEPGDRVTFECGPESVVLVRQRDRGLRAFFNTCPHRGRELCRAGSDHGNEIRCGYHGWEWDLDGTIHRQPLGYGFAEARETLSLSETRVEAIGGYVWVCFDAGAPALADYLGSLAGDLAAYRLDEFELVDDLSVELECNWKIAMDAFSEGYHVPTVHPQLADVIDVERQTVDLFEHHHRIVQPFVGLDALVEQPMPREVLANGTASTCRWSVTSSSPTIGR